MECTPDESKGRKIWLSDARAPVLSLHKSARATTQNIPPLRTFQTSGTAENRHDRFRIQGAIIRSTTPRQTGTLSSSTDHAFSTNQALRIKFLVIAWFNLSEVSLTSVPTPQKVLTMFMQCALRTGNVGPTSRRRFYGFGDGRTRGTMLDIQTLAEVRATGRHGRNFPGLAHCDAARTVPTQASSAAPPRTRRRSDTPAAIGTVVAA